MILLRGGMEVPPSDAHRLYWHRDQLGERAADLGCGGEVELVGGTIWQIADRGAFVRRLGGPGWIEGRTIAIEYRWAEGRGERYNEIAAEFVRLNVDIILTVGSAVIPAKQATTTIPIVF